MTKQYKDIKNDKKQQAIYKENDEFIADMYRKHNKKTIKNELFEKLADIEHQRWADWQKWCHKILRENCPSPELEKVLKRWDKQINTPYSKLSEKEKNSDREQVMRYWKLINNK